MAAALAVSLATYWLLTKRNKTLTKSGLAYFSFFFFLFSISGSLLIGQFFILYLESMIGMIGIHM